MSIEQILETALHDPRLASLSPEQRILEAQKLARSHGLDVSLEQLRSAASALSDADLDHVAGGDGSYWGKLPNHNEVHCVD